MIDHEQQNNKIKLTTHLSRIDQGTVEYTILEFQSKLIKIDGDTHTRVHKYMHVFTHAHTVPMNAKQ